MGFKKSKAMETITVNMNVKTVDEKTNILEDVLVSHTFKIPSPEVREKWNREVVRTKGKKIESGYKSTANYNLWKSCVVNVDGYDDLDQKAEDWKMYFSDAIGRIHVDNAVDILMNLLDGVEEEQEKKLEPSSGQ